MQGVQKENEIHLQQHCRPLANCVVGLVLSEVCDYYSGILSEQKQRHQAKSDTYFSYF